jgi:hypothetical protein
MVTDSNTSSHPPQDSARSNPPEQTVLWSLSYSGPDLKVDGLTGNWFDQGRPQRTRSKTTTKPPDGYLSRAEAATYLGVSVRRLEGDPSIPKFNVAGPRSKRATWRYRKTDLDSWMAGRKHGGNTGRAE